MIALLALFLAVATPPDGGGREIHEIVVTVDGASIRALCTDGPRRAVLLHGEGASADAWLPVLRRLDGVVGACAYDRRGSGASAAAPPERSWYELLDEMRRIHAALGFQQGYVLVGHSLGGLYARLYAADRPRDVAGLVLVEPAHEDLPQRVRPGFPPAEWDAWVRLRERPNADGVVEARVGDRARDARLPAIPVTVITAAIRESGEGWDPRFLGEAARQVHAEILRGVSEGRHVPAMRSTHDVPRDEPGLVADEIARVSRSVGRARH